MRNTCFSPTSCHAHPDIRFSFGSKSSLASCLSRRGWGTHKRLLHRTAQNFPLFGQDRQDHLDIQPSSQRVAAPFPGPSFWDDGSSPLRWCLAPAAPPASPRSIRASGADGAASAPQRSRRLHPSLRYKAITSSLRGWEKRKDARLRAPAFPPHAWLKTWASCGGCGGGTGRVKSNENVTER
jgi:hypothetical protein